MLTRNEMDTMNRAIASAESEVKRLENEAKESSYWPGWIAPTVEQRTAAVARAIYNQLISSRNYAIENSDREESMRVVEMARRLSGTWISETVKNNTVGDAMDKAISATGGYLKEALSGAKNSLVLLKFLPLIAVSLIALYVVSWLPRSRNAR